MFSTLYYLCSFPFFSRERKKDLRFLFVIISTAHYRSNMFISSTAPRNKYVLENHPQRIRGTPEYNPLYDAFQSNILTSDFRPITPNQPPPRFIDNLSSDFESTYDKPRSYHFDNQQFQQQQQPQQLACCSPKKGY